MHPLLVEVVSYASYESHGENIEAGRGEDERALLTTSRFPLPMQNCPIVLLNIVGTCRQDIISHSLTNDEQTASAIQLISSLYDKVSPNISVVVICLYLFQKECIQKEFEKLNWNVLVVSVDGYQAQECDVVVLVTTRSSNRSGGLGDSSDFLRDDCRATVALSRAKHGLFLVGDIETLRGGKVWSRFIDRASDFTMVVGQEYLNVLRSGSCKRDRFGQLLSASGRVVANFVDEVVPNSSNNNNLQRVEWLEMKLGDEMDQVLVELKIGRDKHPMYGNNGKELLLLEPIKCSNVTNVEAMDTSLANAWKTIMGLGVRIHGEEEENKIIFFIHLNFVKMSLNVFRF
uniref:DNA2/NAM7 helicase-like C-terminal domain-containing protein n=1 Tax=Meloidogyne enterolobii TaxID=390850 RepID=A0A6V7Y2W7_MELEN|nr:unnamed protein product [Meloidogyne enterolobii]